MADVIDIANDYAQQEIDRALANRPMMANGNSECACGEPISKIRQNLGATRCIDCQEIWERMR